MKQYITIGIASLAAISTQAQDIKFGKFTTEEITKTKSTITPTAPAEVLYSSAKHKIDWDQSTGDLMKTSIITYRIKIFDKDKTPDHLLTLEIPLGKGNSKSDFEKIQSLKASTFTPEGNGMKEYKVEKKDIFTKNVHNFLDLQTLTFPNVQNGSIIEYAYEVKSPFYYNTDTWYFQESVPVVKSNLVLETNEVLNYSDDFRGQYILKPTTSSKRETANYKTQGSRGINNTTDEFRASSIGSYEYVINTKSYSAENLPGYEKEAYVLNPRNLLSSVRFELASYMPKNGTPQYFSTTWEKIGRDLMDSESFGRQLNGNSFLDDKVKEIIAGKTDELEKTTAIFDFVKTNYKWNNYSGKSTDSGIRKTYNEKTGNAADINLMLISMLEKAGLKANPVVLSTVQNGMLNYVFPSMAKLNYVIAAVNINGNEVLMDATDPNSKVNLLPLRALNHRGILISKTGVKEVNLVNTIMSTDKTQIVATLTADGKLNGTYNNYHDNYFYINDKSEIQEDPKAFEKDFIEEYTFDIENFKSVDNNENLIRHSFKFSNVQTDVIGNKIILNPLIFTALENHNLNYENRNYNIEFGTPMTISKIVKIKIPEGYKVESLPKEYQEKIINDAAGYAYKFEEKDGFIQITSARVLPYSILPSDYYKPFKEFMNKVVEAETQQIVLVKI
ncbi:DUF3857 domain-containing protein [Faecalibacter bovis]|uniref:DUF3857 domain-containing protein n=1 Tax=Faecalibacter bovis TaxID=2898187 RepID=A0ABX7XG81_9FLAO|nr:DUF3857 domain-containing protein [Faecalibacter bovis]QTV06842.1 DUF3857 domain-containing protein [Faecalibacter bovis]